MHLSYSQISCFNNCKQEYKYRYIDKLAPKKFSSSLNFGKYFHLGMELLYKHGNPDIAINTVLDSLDQLSTLTWTDKDHLDMAWIKIVLRAMIDGYYDIFYVDDIERGLEVVELEKKYNLPIVNPTTNRSSRKYNFTFIADAVLKDKNDDLWLVEYKTASQISENYITKLAFDTQITGMLAYLQKVYSRPFKGVLYRIMRKPGIRQTKKETEIQFLERLSNVFHDDSAKYFVEVIIKRTQQELEDFKANLWYTQKDIQNAIKNKYYYKNTSNCVLKGCSFLPMCAKEEGYKDMFKMKGGAS